MYCGSINNIIEVCNLSNGLQIDIKMIYNNNVTLIQGRFDQIKWIGYNRFPAYRICVLPGPPVYTRVCIAQSSAFCVLSFCLLSFGDSIVCYSSYGLYLPIWLYYFFSKESVKVIWISLFHVVTVVFIEKCKKRQINFKVY